MKISTKIGLSFALLTGLLIMMVYVGSNTSNQTKSQFDRVINQHAPTVNALQDLQIHGLHIAMATTRYALFRLVPGSNFEHQLPVNLSFEEELHKHLKEVTEAYELALQRYKRLVEKYFPDEINHVDKIVATGNDIKRLSVEIIKSSSEHKSTQVLIAIRHDLENAAEQFLDAINEVLAHEKAELDDRQNKVELMLRQGELSMIIFAVVALFGTVSLGAIFVRTLSRPLKELEQAANAFSRGELEHKVNIDFDDEIGTLAKAFNHMGTEIQTRTVSRDYLENILRSMGDALIVLNRDGVINSSNRSAQLLLQYSENELLGLSVHKLLDGDKHQSDASIFDGKRIFDSERHFIAKDGRRIPVAISVSPIFEQNGTLTGNVVVVQDITERKQAESHLYKLANYDALTGLPNRMLLMERISLAIGDTIENKSMVAILFCDLDRFKVFNDSLGHHAGDRLLQIVTERFRTCIREGDTVARVGGDEFVVILSNLAGINDVYDITQSLINTVSQPIELDGQNIYSTVSIGISIYPDHSKNPETLVKNADIAMYRAKDKGKNDFQLYKPEMNAKIKQRFSLEGDLRRAIDQQELELYYQPQVHLATNQIIGAEALLRWRHPNKGFIPPLDFIPIAEETGLIIPLGEWILHSACQQAMSWQKNGLPPLRISVNIANRQFSHQNFLSSVKHALEESGLQASNLDLEITENIVMHNPMQALKIMEALKAIGILLSIDDFGTGYSSLSHLRRFPLDTLKIDRSFIKDITRNKDDQVITMTILAMAKQLNLRVIAEGVESVEQRDFVAGLGCDEIQGYFYSKPVPAIEFSDLFGPATTFTEAHRRKKT